MKAKDFVEEYEAALATQDWNSVAPLIGDDARVVFSNGELFQGKEAIRNAFERNFRLIKNEEYRVERVHWLTETASSASYMFEFFWAGEIEGRSVSGSGRGTAVLAFEAGRWLLVGEQLGPKI